MVTPRLGTDDEVKFENLGVCELGMDVWRVTRKVGISLANTLCMVGDNELEGEKEHILEGSWDGEISLERRFVLAGTEVGPRIGR